MGKPLLYDLCCGGGGVAYQALAMGFDVVGVDHEPQPGYQGDFILADALHPPLKPVADVVWVSPYCQGYSPLHYSFPNTAKPRQVNEFREVVRALGKLYVIENSNYCEDLRDAVTLCGFMFGRRFIRHRKFETNFTLPQPSHVKHYGKPEAAWGHSHSRLAVLQEQFGVSLESRKSLNNCVPSVYTQFVLTWAKIALGG